MLITRATPLLRTITASKGIYPIANIKLILVEGKLTSKRSDIWPSTFNTQNYITMIEKITAISVHREPFLPIIKQDN